MTRARIAAGAALLIGAALLAGFAPRLRRDGSLEQLFPRDSEARQRFADFDRAFGTDDTLLVAVHDDDPQPIFRRGALEHLDRIVAAVESDPGVDTVVCLANLDDFGVARLLGRPVPGGLAPLVPADRASVTAADAARLRANPLLAQGLLAPDGRTAAVWILLAPELRRSEGYLDAAARIAAKVPPPGPADGALRVDVTGFPLLHGATLELLMRDAVRLLLAALAIVALVAVAGGVPWRSGLAFLMSWVPVAGALAAWFVLSGRPLHVFSNTLLPLLLVTTGSGFVHVARVLAREGEGGRSLGPVQRACVLTTATTALAFLTLAASSLQPLARLGVEVAVGSALALASWIGFVRAAGATPRATVAIDGLTARLARAPRWLAAPAALACLPWFLLSPQGVGLLGSFMDYLPGDHPRVAAARAVEAGLGAQTPFEVIVELDPRHAARQLRDPGFLVELGEFEAALLRCGGDDLPAALSPVTLLSYLNWKLEGGPEAELMAFRPTEEAARFAIQWLISPWLAMARAGAPVAESPLVQALGDKMRQILAPDGGSLRFGGRIPALPPEQVLALAARLRTEVFDEWTARLSARSIHATGFALLVAETAVEVRATQARSLWTGGLALCVVLALVVREFRLWAIAVAVNALSLSGVLTALWIADARMNLYSTVLVAALLGLVVDNTLHLMLAWRRLRETAADPMSAVLERVGPSMALSSLCLAAGFAAFLASELPIYRQFAWSAIGGIALALYWDLCVAPAWVARR